MCALNRKVASYNNIDSVSVSVLVIRNCQVMSSKILKQNQSVAFNESQLILVTLVGDELPEDGDEGVPLPEGEPVQATPVTPHGSPNIASTTGIKDQPTKSSRVKAVSIVLAATTIILVVGVSVPVVFYYVLVGQVCSHKFGLNKDSHIELCTAWQHVLQYSNILLLHYKFQWSLMHFKTDCVHVLIGSIATIQTSV